MGNVQVLDVTLRDGGCVNNFNFGQNYINKILKAIEESNVDIIELGYIDEIKGSSGERTQYIDEKVIEKNILKQKNNKIKYVAMIDYGKFDIDKLQERTKEGVDGIRLAFHKKDAYESIELGKKIIAKGYDFYVQPMLCLRYSDLELLKLVELVNKKIPESKAFYIVDSFGEMRSNDVIRLMNLVDHNLNPNIKLGFHSHNNLQLAYSNAMSFLSYVTDRDIIIDSSVMGMGKGAGNLNTELLLEHMNIFYGKNYKIIPLLELIDQVISVLHNEFYWGYAVEYYVSSVKHCSPSYAKYFTTKHAVEVNRLSELLGLIEEEKKISFDEKYAEKLYIEYNSINYNDEDSITELKEMIMNRDVLVIAPGKSIRTEKIIIKKYINNKSIISISLNNCAYKTDFKLITRNELVDKSLNKLDNYVIVPSNIATKKAENIYIINYKKWTINVEGINYDSAGIIAMNLLKEVGPRKVYLAGFDGFSLNISDNYFNDDMRRPVNEEKVEANNAIYKKFFLECSEKMKIEFITKSKYTEI